MKQALLTRKAFESACLALAGQRTCQGVDYLQDHWLRLYATYQVAAQLLAQGRQPGRVLSVGAGSAYVEAQLALTCKAHVTVLDFPGMLAAQQAYYERLEFKTCATDLTQPLAGLADYDLIMSCEVVEHLPMAPSHLFAQLVPALVSHGWLLVTTPNLGNLWSLLRLAKGQPLGAEPELAFGPVDFAHEAVHRREYVAGEIRAAMQHNGLAVATLQYTWNTYRAYPGLKSWWFRLLEACVPRWRPVMIMAGQKAQGGAA